MGDFDRTEKERTVLRGLKKLGLSLSRGSKHNLATHLPTGKKTTIPRHKELNKFTVGSICDFLISCGFSEADVKDAFNWKG